MTYLFLKIEFYLNWTKINKSMDTICCVFYLHFKWIRTQFFFFYIYQNEESMPNFELIVWKKLLIVSDECPNNPTKCRNEWIFWKLRKTMQVKLTIFAVTIKQIHSVQQIYLSMQLTSIVTATQFPMRWIPFICLSILHQKSWETNSIANLERLKCKWGYV